MVSPNANKVKIIARCINVVAVISKFFAKFFHCHKFKNRPTIDGEIAELTF